MVEKNQSDEMSLKGLIIKKSIQHVQLMYILKKLTVAVALLLAAVSSQAQQTVKPGQTGKPEGESLTLRQQAIVLTSAFTAKGDLEKLDDALHAALDARLTVNEAKEVIVHVYAYVGFPRSIRGLTTLMSVLEDRKSKGINDQIGKEATPIPDGINKYDSGKKTLEKLTGRPQGELSGYQAFSPAIDKFLKEHLFADIFGRDILNHAERELATVSALISIGGVEPMLQSHLRISMNQGITEIQLLEIFALFEKSIGRTEAEAARKVYAELSESKTIPITGSSEQSTGSIFSKGQRNPNTNMVGTVWLYNMVVQDSLYSNQVGNVTFEPGARTNWHSHYAGQILLVTDGVGYHQIRGESVRLIKKGDVIECPPNIEHWHGATPTNSLTHIAITQNTGKGRVTWSGKVTDAEYNSYSEDKNK